MSKPRFLGDGEYDAAEIDRDVISTRLKQDVMEHSGKVHSFIADSVGQSPLSYRSAYLMNYFSLTFLHLLAPLSVRLDIGFLLPRLLRQRAESICLPLGKRATYSNGISERVKSWVRYLKSNLPLIQRGRERPLRKPISRATQTKFCLWQ